MEHTNKILQHNAWNIQYIYMCVSIYICMDVVYLCMYVINMCTYHMTAWICIVMRMYEGMYVMLVCMYDNGTCESYPCVGTDGDLNIGLHCVGGGHSSVGRVAQHRDER
jgi:hypothetical protein